MITATLIGIIATLLFGGAAGIFLIPDIEKKIKKLIGEKQRANAMIDSLKAVSLADKERENKRQGYKKQLALLMKNPTTSRQELTALFDASLESVRSFQNALIRHRAVLIDNLSEEEFTEIIDPDSSATAKRENETAASWEKVGKKLGAAVDEAATIARSSIEDPERRRKALSAIDDYKQGIDALVQRFKSWNLRDNTLLKDYAATDAQFHALAEEFNSIRTQVYTAFVDLYIQLSESSTEKEWKAASTALKKMVH